VFAQRPKPSAELCALKLALKSGCFIGGTTATRKLPSMKIAHLERSICQIKKQTL